jgi:hypothetical protein
MPSLDFLSAGQFKFPENDMNVSPLGTNTAEFKTTSSKTLSLSAVAAEVGADREHVAYLII